ncbi:hypothetical protein [Shewanella acanthi]|uniref:hypothetical protein n=1 Tax=Shewanella acanthi TaxID=2864212 RepID=UPI001C654DD8|nr:hypothetical protein [Shewanella acanthi]QYJ78335.1 hypothetical protein K0H61_14690 [Shewanella acanthi]
MIKSKYIVEEIKDIPSDKIINAINNSDLFISYKGLKRNIFDFENNKLDENKFILVNDYDESNLKEKIKKVISDSIKEDFNICIDISLISRKTFSEIISTLAIICINKKLIIEIVYSLAKYSPPAKGRFYNNLVKPVSNFFRGWALKPGMPVMTIVGIGYERDKAIGAIEYLESSKTMLYIPDSIENAYKTDVLDQNSNIISSVSTESLIDYTVERPSEIIYSLDTLISSHKNRFKTVLLPFGPKIFFAASLISAIAHPETSVWYVSGEERDTNSSQDREIVASIGFSCSIKTICAN